MKDKVEELLKKYPYGNEVFYLKFSYEGKIIEMTHYAKHFFARDAYLEIDAPYLRIPYENIIEIKRYSEIS